MNEKTLRYDAVIIGGGHNGLVCGAYLAKIGKRVCVLEKRPTLGGAAATEEIWQGFAHPGGPRTVLYGLQTPPLNGQISYVRCEQVGGGGGGGEMHTHMHMIMHMHMQHAHATCTWTWTWTWTWI